LKIFRVVFLLLLSPLVVTSGLPQESKLDSLRAIYEKNRQKLEKQHEARMNRILVQYGEDLTRCIELLRSDGDPEAVLQAIGERDRFVSEQQVFSTTSTDLPPIILDAQKTYSNAILRASCVNEQALFKLVTRYIEALDVEMRALTREDRLTEAIEVKREKKRIAESTAEARGRAEKPRELDIAALESPITDHQGTPPIAKKGKWRDVHKPVRNPKLPSVSKLMPGSREAQALQQQTAREYKLPLEIKNRFSMHFRLIPPGTCVDSSGNTITIHRPFFITSREVTMEAWNSVLGKSTDKDRKAMPAGQGHFDFVSDFMTRLRGETGLPPETYRLPTESEWEYACRAGTVADTYGPIDDVAWHAMNGNGQTHAAGEKLPNAWGLYDMLGNVVEWCDDSFVAGLNVKEPLSEPVHEVPPHLKAGRGGHAAAPPSQCVAGSQHTTGHNLRGAKWGFRVLLRIPTGTRGRLEKPHVPGTTSKRSQGTVSDRVVHFRNKQFLYVTSTMTWQAASDWCKKRDATLACIGDERENEFVCQLVRRQDGQSFWGGGTDHDREGQWEWMDGTAFNYVNWTGRQPDNSGGREHFLQIHLSGVWNDNTATHKMPFVAQWTNTRTP
jgi:hypothetical protein